MASAAAIRHSEPVFSARSPEIRMPALEALNLRKLYGDHVAVDDLSLAVEPGEILGLLGPNGAGKSTTMLMLAGLLEPTSGSVRLNGQPFTIRDRQLRTCLGVVPQDLAIYPDLTALENLRFFGEIYGLRGDRLRQRCATVLEQIGLAQVAQQRAAEFSGGMQRRLNFGIAVLHDPAVLMLDEPTVGVDPQSRVHLLDCVRALAAGGTAILYASHYMEEVQALCQRVAIIDHGRRLAYDSLANLLEGVTGRILLSVSGAVALHGRLAGSVREIASTNSGVQLEVSAPDGRWEFLLPEVLQQIRLAGVTVERIETSHSDLERLFLSLTGRKLRD